MISTRIYEDISRGKEVLMKEDILEQVAKDFYSKKVGYFTKHNIKFRPSKEEKTI